MRRILDLACGYGRHSLTLTEKGFSVGGVDITREFIDDAIKESKARDLSAEFICSDIRNIDFNDEFDVVLNLADGAIGCLETEEENLKIFDAVSRPLKSGGKQWQACGSRSKSDLCVQVFCDEEM